MRVDRKHRLADLYQIVFGAVRLSLMTRLALVDTTGGPRCQFILNITISLKEGSDLAWA